MMVVMLPEAGVEPFVEGRGVRADRNDDDAGQTAAAQEGQVNWMAHCPDMRPSTGLLMCRRSWTASRWTRKCSRSPR